jgi:hypothetical protein
MTAGRLLASIAAAGGRWLRDGARAGAPAVRRHHRLTALLAGPQARRRPGRLVAAARRRPERVEDDHGVGGRGADGDGDRLMDVGSKGRAATTARRALCHGRPETTRAAGVPTRRPEVPTRPRTGRGNMSGSPLHPQPAPPSSLACGGPATAAAPNPMAGSRGQPGATHTLRRPRRPGSPPLTSIALPGPRRARRSRRAGGSRGSRGAPAPAPPPGRAPARRAGGSARRLGDAGCGKAAGTLSAPADDALERADSHYEGDPLFRRRAGG